MQDRFRMGIKLKITLAFSLLFIMLSILFGLIGYSVVRRILVEVADNRGTLATNLQAIRATLILICTSSVVISAIASYIVARLLLVPLQRIIHAARNITSNKMRDPIPVNGAKDELHELSVTINEMIFRIDEAVQQQQNFFGSASHELKTPLAILRTELEVGLRKPGLEEGVRHLLSSQLEEISRLQAIVNEFLVVSQLRVGSPNIYKKPFDLSVLIVKVFNQLLPLLRQKNLEPVIHFDEETADYVVQADEDKIRIVLLNLLENAAKYAVKNTPITCRVDRAAGADGLIVQFVNTTNEEKVATDYLQVAFYRSDLMQKGAGLGLWLCNEIIRLHRGRITVTSSHHRFEVTVNLPLSEGPGVEPANDQASVSSITETI